ncbi:transglycosylase SLT domain-containing protein (plasmid) [Azospirillum sp. HJ39]|uniref:transglycosylase SLT domain-containing protein n=1 Tax=Azospirillum sp. HJ39 TaxID=3159496 RepID=UPI003557A204
MHRKLGRLAAAATLALCAIAAEVRAATVCDLAAQVAASVLPIPRDLLVSVAQVESSRQPWVLNIDGRDSRHATRQEAAAAMRRALDAGASNVDAGCWQISSRWHGRAFRHPDDMLDPLRNALYASLYLLDLRQESGNWTLAVQRYHSRDPARGDAYAGRVADVLSRVVGARQAQGRAAPNQ